MSIPKPYLVFLGAAVDPSEAKTGFGVRDWAPGDCIAQLRLPGCAVDLNLPEMAPRAARMAGARSVLIGVAPVGGQISDTWVSVLMQAADAGLSIVSGLHARLEAVPGLAALAAKRGVQLVNVRTPPADIPVGTGIKRSGRRLLTVGTDCALGKKYTALAVVQELRAHAIPCDFRATGQTGILISGTGLPIDTVVADFVSGAAEMLSPNAPDGHWDVIEGQGSLLHPGYAAVTLGLLHGSQPDALVLCHDPLRASIVDSPHIRIPPLREVARMYLEAASLTNDAVRLAGVSLNTSRLDDAERKRLLEKTAGELGVPCFDPMRTSAEPVVKELLREPCAETGALRVAESLVSP